MLKSVLLFLALGIGLMHPTYSSSFLSDDVFSNGVFPSGENALIRFQIERNFNLKLNSDRKAVQKVISQAIEKANPRSEGLDLKTSENLPQEITRISSCYGIDPVIFTALIWRESNFKPSAISETGAAGYTQMTNRGIREVLDRLSPTSHRRLGYLRSLVKRCDAKFLVRVPPIASADTVAAWKNSVSVSTVDSLVMGALLFKINLASVHPNPQRITNISYYRNALERYNGDPNIKTQFATDVLLLSKRMMELPEVALNDSKFLSQIQEF